MSNVALRTSIAQAVSSLRRVRPRTSFYELPAHTVPTKWRLYRGLLRLSPTSNISWQIRALFRRDRILTSATLAKAALKSSYRMLDTLRLASEGDIRSADILARYDRFIAFRRKKQYWDGIYDKELEWINRMRNRPIMTGGHIAPTYYNPPLPRLKPQPMHISGMIVKRKRARERRTETFDYLNSLRVDMLREAQFEDELANLHPDLMQERVFTTQLVQEWNRSIVEQTRLIQDQLSADYKRAHMRFTPEMLAMIRRARGEKIRNKTRERERERRGEVLTSTLKRARKRPPTRILRQLTPDQQFEDAIARLPGEGGFVGAVKRKLGYKLRSNTWRIENGRVKNRGRLERMERQIREANARKRYFTRPGLLVAELEEIAKPELYDPSTDGSLS